MADFGLELAPAIQAADRLTAIRSVEAMEQWMEHSPPRRIAPASIATERWLV